MQTPVFVFYICTLLMYSAFCHAGIKDREWEQQIAAKLAEDAAATEVVWLEAGGDEFIGLFNQQTGVKAAGAAIILHGMGGHADWPRVISPLRQSLPEQHWTTLSIQLPLVAIENPIEDYGKTLNAAADRIQAAVRFLRKRKFMNIVIIGQSFGAASALYYLAQPERPKALAMVAIGLQDYAFLKPNIDVLVLIEKTSVPLLDIYGEHDYRRVVEQAPDRRLAAKKANNKKYTQIEIQGANHYFYKNEELLAKRIRGWLDSTAPDILIMQNREFDGNEEENEPLTE